MADSSASDLSRSPPAGSPLVGRVWEQALLRQALDEMLAGCGSLVLVSGEAGIGKTALVEWLAGDAEAAGCLVLRGGCYDLTTTPPFGPWREIRGGRTFAAGQAAMPTFDAGPMPADALVHQGELVDQTWAALAAIAARQPLLLVLEDLHWADPASLDLLRVIARRVRDARLVLVASYRSDDLARQHPLSQILPVLIRESSPRRIELRRLNPDAIAMLIARRYALDPTSHARLVGWLAARSEGNPFFLEELLHSLEHQQLRQGRSGAWVLDDLQRVPVPALLRHVIDARLARLGAEAVELLGIGAVIGHQVPLELWATVSQASSDDLATTIEDARAAAIMLDLPDGSGWQFRHALLREALYEELVSVRRRTWHRQVAEALAAGGHPDPDAVAHHFRQAHDDRAVDWLIRAGERAAALYASQTAVERLEAVLPALEASGDDRRRGWILWLLGEQLALIDPERAYACLDEAERLGALIGDQLLVAQARVLRGFRVNFGNFRNRAAVSDLTAGVDLLDGITALPLVPPPIYAPGWSHPTIYHAFRALGRAMVGNLAGALADIPQSVISSPDHRGDQQHPAGRPPMTLVEAQSLAFAYNALGRVRAMQGRPGESAQAFESCVALMARTHDDTEHGIMWKDWLAYLVLPYFADDLELRRTVLERHDRAWEQAAEKLGAGPMPGEVSHLLTAYLDGAWSEMDEMERWWHEHISMSTAWGIVREAVFARRAHGRGDFGLAWREIHHYLPQGPATEPGDRVFRGVEELQRVAIELALDSGNLADAHDWLQAHGRWLAWSGAVTGRADGELLRARYHLARGERAPASRLAAQALAVASDPRQPLALLAIHRFLGQLDAADQHVADAERHLRGSLRLAECCGAPFERALTLVELAELRLTQQCAAEAAQLLGEVRAICEPLGAAPTLARVDTLRQRLVSGDPRGARYPAGLSQREVEILQLLAAGLSNPAIGERLFISPKTVEHHVGHILAKLAVTSRAQAAAFAAMHGLTAATAHPAE